MRTGRNWSAARPPLRANSVMKIQKASQLRTEQNCSAILDLSRKVLRFAGSGATDRFVDLGDRALDGFVVEVFHRRVEHAGLDGGGEHAVADAVGGNTTRRFEAVRRLPLEGDHGHVVGMVAA